MTTSGLAMFTSRAGFGSLTRPVTPRLRAATHAHATLAHAFEGVIFADVAVSLTAAVECSGPGVQFRLVLYS
ncbi:hypothetical protein SAMN05421783_10768 [Thiocapsa roseopersicina]|uniref:Uncharacterized protein n=1 Tax=Thiocapsa roseopersicina TaxID=1058 RepID=A0A1H2VLZ0_THIRO|nr:hypothetical protein SAMN05421783_10768 [Thiocapsa roseopersicina]